MLWCIDITLAAVVNLTAVVLSSSSVMVTWQDDPQNNSSILAYSVHYYSMSPRRPEVQRVVTIPNDTLRNLRPDTEYVIYITAYTHAGKSRPSQRVTARTLVEGTQISVVNFNEYFYLLKCIKNVQIDRHTERLRDCNAK